MGCIGATGMWVRRHRVDARYGGELCCGCKIGEVMRREKRTNTLLAQFQLQGEMTGGIS
jgi:hypothetical protein